MPLSLSIDKQGNISSAWVDDKSDRDASAPLGNDGLPVVLVYTGDNDAAGTVSGSAVSPVAEGSLNVLTAANNATDGTPANWPDGTPGGVAGTPITAAPFGVTVVAGAAGTLETVAS